MDLKIKGKTALIMGSSSGLGFAIAHALAQEGAQIAICSRNEEKLRKAKSQLGSALAVACDLTQPGATTSLIKSVKESMGSIDILVTNAGGPPKGTFNEVTSEQWGIGFQSLWMSAVEAIQGVLPGMQARHWGRIILVTSVAAKEAMPHLTISNGLRAGLIGLTKSISNEVAASGITINAILPGYIKTDRLKELGIPEEQMTSKIPAGRLAAPEELAALATFLASEPASYITGQAIACDGGYMKGI